MTEKEARQDPLEALAGAGDDLRFALGRYLHDFPQQRIQAALGLLKQQAELLHYDPAAYHSRRAVTEARLAELLAMADQELSLARREILPADPRRGLFRLALESYITDDFPRLYPHAALALTCRLEALEDIFDSG